MRVLPLLARSLLALPALGLAGAACDRVVGFRWVDPPVDVGDAGPDPVSGDPALAMGYYVEQLLDLLHDGDGCPIIYGLQGGTWTMPALRTTGIGTVASVTCDLVTDTDEHVGHVEAQQSFVLATDGWLEVQAFPVPVVHAPPNEAAPIEDLYGVHATLTCSVSAGVDREASQTLKVVLVQG